MKWSCARSQKHQQSECVEWPGPSEGMAVERFRDSCKYQSSRGKNWDQSPDFSFLLFISSCEQSRCLDFLLRTWIWDQLPQISSSLWSCHCCHLDVALLTSRNSGAKSSSSSCEILSRDVAHGVNLWLLSSPSSVQQCTKQRCGGSCLYLPLQVMKTTEDFCLVPGVWLFHVAVCTLGHRVLAECPQPCPCLVFLLSTVSFIPSSPGISAQHRF